MNRTWKRAGVACVGLVLWAGCHEDIAYRGEAEVDGAGPERGRGEVVEASRLLERHRDEGCDGVPESACMSYEYDHRGSEIVKRYDPDCDGAEVEEVCQTYRYGLGGEVVFHRRDVGCDGIELQCTTIEYDAQGRETKTAFDNGCTGVASRCTETQYDARGRVVWEKDDPGCGGGPNSFCTHHEYDDRGNLTASCFSAGCDGSGGGDECLRYEYDEAGHQVSSWEEHDHGLPQIACVRRRFDAEGRITEEVLDGDCEGEGAPSCLRYTYDGRGNLVRKDRDDCEGGGPSCWVYAYDADDRQVTERQNVDCASRWAVRCKRFEHDEAGNVVTTESDEDCDGLELVCEVSVYE